MKRLYLLRHAKADHTKEVEDEHRALSKAGVSACQKLAKHLLQLQYMPETIIASSAVRTKDTAKYIAKGLKNVPAPIECDALYLASPGEMIREINSVNNKSNSLMVVGHNPGIHQLSIILAGQTRGDCLERITKEFVPAACAVFDFDIDAWEELEPATGVLVDFIDPRKL